MEGASLGRGAQVSRGALLLLLGGVESLTVVVDVLGKHELLDVEVEEIVEVSLGWRRHDLKFI